jgi:acyl-CoA dehydrogenase
MADRSFLGWPFFDDAHRALAARLESWVDRELVPLTGEEPAAAALDETTKRLLSALAGGGWLKYCVPAAWGGTSEKLDVRSLCLIRETLARTSGLADFAFAMQGLGSAPIAMFGSDALRADILPGIVRGERIGAFALSEPEAGSNPAEMTARARRDGGHYAIDGEKTWISNAGLATQYVVFARTGEAGSRGLSAFVVAADAPGLTVAERIDVIAPHPLGRLRLEGCLVPESHRLGAEGDGYKIAMATLDVFRATVGAAALGFARRALDEAVSWVSGRRIGGQALAEYQMTKDKIADMVVAIDAAALLVYRAAWTLDVLGTRASRESSEAKLFATEAAQGVIDHAVQLHGGQGVVSGAPVEVLYREIRALRVYEGTSEIQKLIIARETLRVSLRAAAGETGSA